MTAKQTVDIIEAAELMKVHPKTVQDLIHDGAIPAAKVGRAWVMMTKDVLTHIEKTIARQTAERMRKPLPKSPQTRRQVTPA